MASLNELLDRIKDRRGLDTDTALAAALGVKKQTLSNWRNGHNMPDPVACATIADLAGEPLARVLGIVGEARAVSRDEKAVWRRLATAAALASVAVVVPYFGQDSAAFAWLLALPLQAEPLASIGIMRSAVLLAVAVIAALVWVSRGRTAPPALLD